jgi:integrase
VGKLHADRYLPLHPNLVTLIDDYRAKHVPADHPLLTPRPNGTALDRHAVTRMINRAGRAAGLPHLYPHQLRHTLATSHQPRHEPGGDRRHARALPAGPTLSLKESYDTLLI